MRSSGRRRLVVRLAIAWVASCLSMSTGCGREPVALSDFVPPRERVCSRVKAPESYEVYFVIDVSGSMGPFLKDLRDQIVAFTESIPDVDSNGRRTRADYYVVAFVNDVKWFPKESVRSTSPIAVQDALDQAIEAGSQDLNLTQRTFNAEPTENLLDALSSVVDLESSADARLMLIATDAPFAEAPAVLSTRIAVASTYEGVREKVEALGFRVHVFSPPNLDGLTRPFEDLPPLSSLPGSTMNDLNELMDAEDRIGATLELIAENASCQ